MNRTLGERIRNHQRFSFGELFKIWGLFLQEELLSSSLRSGRAFLILWSKDEMESTSVGPTRDKPAASTASLIPLNPISATHRSQDLDIDISSKPRTAQIMCGVLVRRVRLMATSASTSSMFLRALISRLSSASTLSACLCLVNFME
ncbi:hypothetical protein BDV06DRAFT_71224 [Aspergillus oleicola]